MAVTKITSTLGEINTNFYLNDFTVYLMNTSSTGGYASTDWEVLGYTSPEKSINPIQEKYVREDKIPRVPTYTKTIRKGMEITTGLSNLNEDLMAVFLQGTKSSVTSPTGTQIAVGTEEAPQEYRCIRFAGLRDDKSVFAITIPKCEIMYAGEWTIGGESETVQNLLFKAYYNSAAADTKDLYYMSVWNSGISPTADTAIGYA